MSRLLASVSLLPFFLLAPMLGCGAREHAPGSAAGEGKINVVASIFPLADVAGQVGGDRVNVITLLPPGQSPHEFEPKPRQAESLAGADLLITVGLGLDLWAQRAAQASGSRIPHTVVLANLLSKPDAGGTAPLPGQPGGEEVHGTDPHVWLDIALMARYANALATEFSSLDPEHTSEYVMRAARYRAQLTALDDEYRRELSAVPNKAFVSFHAAFGYIAARYSLTEVSLMDVNAVESGPRRIEAAITFIREHHIRTIFAEPDMSEEQFRSIAAQTGAKVAYLDDIGNPTVPGYDSYLALMRSNLAALVRALKE